MSRDVTTVDLDRDHGARARLEKENEHLRGQIARLKSGAVNSGFVQVSRKYLDELDELAFRSPAARKLLTTLIKAMDRQNAVMISQASLVALTGLSEPTVKRAVALLRKQKWVEVLKVGTSNVYRVNSAVVWQARADGKWASFSAEVVVNFREQDKATQEEAEDPQRVQLRNIPMIRSDEDVLVTGAALGNEDPPEQSQLDFHSA